ncbi:trypsin-like peptidase domain-containing protein [Phycicoccus endophyticus]|uniref:Trypsin-like peptidase domain-containing protein n=1 Tax=Phycicoccus endophyticus TaxID=1690220 RepID=A0A7G9R260_9MICO|nr:trypsin-like peptidase domain-containing protein [Phycicoccus endophyticus]NHI19664.1 PDZ domain-containing protein [Phycicoccus endophyticus]QNN49685.1 trypsin-like peptidase domain-containing protein [Phycicoccus endophyticus]GGL34076.1 hypothetical protein GCM10012283_15650 [Phycicoccus endophyticus]
MNDHPDTTGRRTGDWTAPQWYNPGGEPAAPAAPGTSTEPLPPAQHPENAPSDPAAPPPPSGPAGSAGSSGSPATPSSGTGRRRVAELVGVAVLAALLSSGGTYAATRLGDDGASTTSTASSTTQLGRGTDTAPVEQADASAPDWAATADAVAPSVVAITATLSNGEAQGSGVIIDSSGHVVTNNHVVSGAQSLQVTLSDGRTFSAQVKGTDSSTDLAVITIDNAPSDLTPIAMGDSDELEVGDPVMAVGNPLGLAGTVTTGIVSALNRPVTTESESEQQDPFNGGYQQQQSEPVVTNAIQTSAAINPGNSGGALVNASGQLVGINSSIASLGSSSSQSGSIGIGFAIPVTEVRSIAEQLIDTGTAQHAYLGVYPQDGTASDGSATRAGAEIAQVESGTPAEKAGLQKGDVIIALDGDPVDSAESLVGYVREQSVGSTVTLTVLRDGESIEVKATLAAAADTTD